MDDHRHLPDVDRLSVVIALILIAYSTTAFIHLPTRSIEIQFPGFLLQLNLNFNTLIASLSALLAAAGSDWLLTSHPSLDNKLRWQHWPLPAFSAIAVGITLGTLPLGPTWWIVFALGAVLMAGVLVSEYISADPYDLRFSFAVIGLTAVSYALFLIIIISIVGAGFRLYILLSALVPTVFLVAARTLFLRLGGKWALGWAGGITLILTQIAAALYYLPLTPLQLSMCLLGLLYGLIAIAVNLEEKRSGQAMWIEPVLMTVCFIVLGFLL